MIDRNIISDENIWANCFLLLSEKDCHHGYTIIKWIYSLLQREMSNTTFLSFFACPAFWKMALGSVLSDGDNFWCYLDWPIYFFYQRRYYLFHEEALGRSVGSQCSAWLQSLIWYVTPCSLVKKCKFIRIVLLKQSSWYELPIII